ncbi:MAG: hypothetical protein KAV00_06940 [Phycisphaerae bacterium]|nr:hypothetical protein [Phycisphaerae bacterium]
MNDAKKLEAIRELCDAAKKNRIYIEPPELDAILDPPEPIGYIDNDTLPEPGTKYVFDSHIRTRTVLLTGYSSRAGIFTIWYRTGTASEICSKPITTWNSEFAPDVTAVIPPAEQQRPKIALELSGGNEIRMRGENDCVFIRVPNLCDRTKWTARLKNVLKSAGIEVVVD